MPSCLRCDVEQLLAHEPVRSTATSSGTTSRRSLVIAMSCLVVTAACWGSAFRLTEVALVSVAPLELTFIRCLIGSFVVGVAVAIQSTRRRPEVRVVAPSAARRRTARRSVLVGGTCTGIAYAAVSLGQVGATSTTTGVVLGTVPVWTALVAWGIGRRSGRSGAPSRRLLAALLLGTAAAAVPAALDPGHAPLGSVAILAVAAVAHACSMATIQPAVLLHGPLRTTLVVTVIATVLLLPFALVGSWPRGLDPAVWAAVFALGVLPTGIAYITFFEAVRRLGARTAALAVYLIPAVALLTGWLSSPDLIAPGVLLGAAFGILAVVVGVVERPERVRVDVRGGACRQLTAATAGGIEPGAQRTSGV